MAGSFNKVILMGNLTRDIELKHVSGDMAVGVFGLAVNRKFRTKDGENREEVTFVDCEAWGRTAETMSQYLHKGRPVFVEGRLKLDTWEDKDGGGKRSKLKVVVEEFRFIDSRPGSESGGGGGAGRSSEHSAGGGTEAPRGGARSAKPPSGPSSEAMYEPIGEDDIPF